MEFIKKYALYLAWVIALISTFASLYYGEALGNEPCPLCWYQRICLYPLVFVLGVAAYKIDRKIWHYVIYQVALGSLFALYQLFINYLPVLPLCGERGGCRSYDAFLGIPFPFLSFLSFVTILVLIIAQDRLNKTN